MSQAMTKRCAEPGYELMTKRYDVPVYD